MGNVGRHDANIKDITTSHLHISMQSPHPPTHIHAYSITCKPDLIGKIQNGGNVEAQSMRIETGRLKQSIYY